MSSSLLNMFTIEHKTPQATVVCPPFILKSLLQHAGHILCFQGLYLIWSRWNTVHLHPTSGTVKAHRPQWHELLSRYWRRNETRLYLLANPFVWWVRKRAQHRRLPAGRSTLSGGMCRRNERLCGAWAEVTEDVCRAERREVLQAQPPQVPLGGVSVLLTRPLPSQRCLWQDDPDVAFSASRAGRRAAPRRRLAEGPCLLRTAALVSGSGSAAACQPAGRPPRPPGCPPGGAASPRLSPRPVTAVVRRAGRAPPSRQSPAALFVTRAVGPRLRGALPVPAPP